MGWPPALRKLKELLYEVHLAADAPSLDEIVRDIADDDGLPGSPGPDTVHRLITDNERPGQQADVVAVATVLARRARWDAPDLAGRVRELWVQAGTAQGAGRPISDLRGDVRLVLDGGLGVHPALDTDGARERFGALPAYVPRDHDAHVKAVVDAAKAGHSGIAVLVGGSSTGKTRALWEAVGELPDSWRLWHPLSPTAPDAVLASLPDIAPKTVVWLNEAQHYLTPTPLGEQVAAGLRELLNDPSRGPVLVLGTLWPQHWDTLTTRDRHAGARELLGGHKIDVPDAFTPADLAALDATDPRLAQAAQDAKSAQVTQYLAGVPYLMDRYGAARRATLAFIHAAMDARRLGAGLHLPLAWLADAAPGYLDDDEYRTLDRNWLTRALDYVTTSCNGIPGILTLVTNSGPRNQRTRREPTPSPQGPHYLLADYLDQHGRQHRAETIPPIDFWTAAAQRARPADLCILGEAAWSRGLYRDAAQLHKNATAHGDPNAPQSLVSHFRDLHPTDPRPAHWAAAHAAIDHPGAVSLLFDYLTHGAVEQAMVLAKRAAAHVALDDPGTVLGLLARLRRDGAIEQATTLATRAATHMALDDPGEVTRLLDDLRRAGAVEQAMVLAKRAAAHVALDRPKEVAHVLQQLRVVYADDQVAALLARDPAAHVALDDPGAVAHLLYQLREAGAVAQVAALLSRDPAAQVALDDPGAVAHLLYQLREAGAVAQVAALLSRDPAAHVAVSSAYWVDNLLRILRMAGGGEQADALATRFAAHVDITDSNELAGLLWHLRENECVEQAVALLARDPAAHVTINDPAAVAALLSGLRVVCADEQIAALLARDPAAHATFDDPYGVSRLLYELRWAGAVDQANALLARDPAAHVTINDPAAVAALLGELQEAGAVEQVAALLARDHAAHVSLDDPRGVTGLLNRLQKAGAVEQVAALLARNPAIHVPFDDPEGVAGLLYKFREAGAVDQVTVLLARNPAAHVPLNDPNAVTKLVDSLRKVGADDQAKVLAERLPATGSFHHFIRLQGNAPQFRLGREPDGRAALSWDWGDLE
ncbi:hypothetical protein AQJ58_25755 [Streptomyces sp. DSM 15324]|nr:hypothetical protein AQJ58_25755 [Streptomyces sp. DSM 15324]